MDKFIIREANQDDISGIVRLRHAIKEFRAIESEEYISFWNSIVSNNPAASPQILIALNEQNEIVAHYAMVSFRFMKVDTALLGGFLCQLMVREDYRHQLIFPRMELMFLKTYKERGFDFAFSLGNREQVVKAHLSFGFRKIGEMPVYAKPYKISAVARRRIKNRLANTILTPGFFIAEKLIRRKRISVGKDFEVCEIAEFDSAFDPFLTEVQTYFPYSALRNSSILNWRFAGSPSIRYTIMIVKRYGVLAGYAVLRRMPMNGFDVLAIVDILFRPDQVDAGVCLLNAAHIRAVELDVELSACLLNPHDPLHPVFKKCGYIRSPESFALFVHEPKGSVNHFTEDSFEKWHLTWFDNDAV